MPYSQQFKINVNKLNSDEALLILLKIEHSFLSEPIRLVRDSDDIIFGGDLYVKMPFEVKRQNDVQGELPKVTLTIANAGRSLVKWVDSAGGGRDSKITVMLVRRSSPTIEELITFAIASCTVNTDTITFNLIIQNNLTKRAIKWVYNTDHSPGLFV